MYLLAEFVGDKSYRNGDINSHINSYMDALDSQLRCAILQDFQNQEYRFTFPKSWVRLAEKTEEEEEHRQLQYVLHFTQAQ